MKRNIITLLLLIATISILAQDTIIKINGELLISKVEEISSTMVKYKKFSNLDGPIYSIEKGDVKEIVFENGEVEVFVKKIDNVAIESNTNSVVQQDKAQVYFIRSTGFAGSMSAFTAFIDENLVCKLNNKKYSIHEITPGEHSFTVQFAGKSAKKKAEPITIEVEAGKTYYVQMVFQTGAFKNNLYCQEVTENSAKTILVDCEEDTKCL